MKYFKLSNTINTDEIGKDPQCIYPSYRGDIGSLGFGNELIEIKDLPKPKLYPDANATTFIHAVMNDSLRFLVIKQNFINLLKFFDIGEYQSWALTVEHQDKVLDDYSLFFTNYTTQEIINFRLSEFLIGKLGDWRDPSIRKPVEVSNYKNYVNLIEILRESEDDSQIRCNKLVLDFSDLKLDFFRIGANPILHGYFISEKLKLAIEKAGFTGMEFKEISEIDKRIEVIY